jgi:hypothetical protein
MQLLLMRGKAFSKFRHVHSKLESVIPRDAGGQASERYEPRRVWVRVSIVTKEGKRIFQKETAKAFFSGTLLRVCKKSDSKPNDSQKKKKKKNSLRTSDWILSYLCRNDFLKN